MVGGSGLYVNAVLKGFDEFPDIAPEIRAELNSELESKGLEVLQEELKRLDPKSYGDHCAPKPASGDSRARNLQRHGAALCVILKQKQRTKKF